MIHVDLVVVYHNDFAAALIDEMRTSLQTHEPTGGYRLLTVDNRVRNRGFAAAANLGATHPRADAALIGFLHPDLAITEPFIATVRATLTGDTVMASHEAATFVTRDWFQALGGFDIQFIWSHETLDLLRRTEQEGRHVATGPATLVQRHFIDSSDEARYKDFYREDSAAKFNRKWGIEWPPQDLSPC